jgi:hypothetical protein
MEAFSAFFDFMAGAPAIIGLCLTALIIFITSDWRLSLAALLIQYVLVGLVLTRFIQPEVAIVKVVVGVMVVPILYLGARHMPGKSEQQGADEGGAHFLGLDVGWDAGPLGLPLRILAILLVALALVRLFGQIRLPWASTDVSIEIALAAVWMGSMGVIGLVLSGGPLRVASALLTILAGFDLVYATLERSLAIVGFYGALTLLTALAFSYLVIAQAMGENGKDAGREGTEL